MVDDKFKYGCPCGKDFDEIISQMNDTGLKFRMIKINEILNKFEKYLRDRLDDY